MIYVLLILAVVLSVLRTSASNNYAKKVQPDMKGIFLFNIFCYGAAVIVALCVGLGTSFSYATIICASLHALCAFLLQTLSVYGMINGAMSTISLMTIYGLIIPTIAGPIFWKESFGVLQLMSVVLLLFISMWLLNEKSKSNVKLNIKWQVVALLCFLLSGLSVLAEKIHQSTDGREEKIMFLFIACFLMFVMSTCGYLLLMKNGKKTEGISQAVLNGGLSGIILGIFSPLSLTLAGNLDSIILYPVLNGGQLILTVLISLIVFKEKLSKSKMVGIAIGFVSIILLSING